MYNTERLKGLEIQEMVIVSFKREVLEIKVVFTMYSKNPAHTST